MTFLLDANVLVYAATEDPRSDASRRILAAVVGGDADGRVSAAVLEEVWHLELARRITGISGLTRRAYDAFEPLLAATDEAFRLALNLPPNQLGANDRIHAGTCLSHGIETIVSADRNFDELKLPIRVDPLDSERVDALLGSD